LLAFAAALLGLLLRRVLPKHHLSDESKVTVDRTIGIIVTLAALVLGLLVASAKQSYDAISDKLQQISADVVLLDSTIVRYGPETKDARDLLRAAVASAVRARWPETGIQVQSSDGVKPWTALQEVYERLRKLAPSDEARRLLQARAIQLCSETARATWLLLELTQDRVPPAFLLILVRGS
jgi:nucleotide-binding universal stress UspA family protein